FLHGGPAPTHAAALSLHDALPSSLRIPPISGGGRHPNVQAEPAFRKGWFEVQDAGSQMATVLAGARPGDQVLDFCAGAGGKTLADRKSTRLNSSHVKISFAGFRSQ